MEELMQEVYDLFTNSLHRQLNRVNYISNLRTFLDILNPDLIYQQMVAGANNYLQSKFQATLSEETFATIDAALDNLQEIGNPLISIWEALDHYEKYEIWEGVDENEISGSALVGAVIGSVLLPGVGTFLGAMFGQASSQARIESEVETMTSHYVQGITNFVGLYDKCVVEVILPAIADDFLRAMKQLDAA